MKTNKSGIKLYKLWYFLKWAMGWHTLTWLYNDIVLYTSTSSLKICVGLGCGPKYDLLRGVGGGGLKDRWGPKRQGVVTNNNLTVFFIWATVNIYIKKIMKYNKSDHLLHVMTNKGTSYIIFTRKIWHDDIPLWKTKYKVCKCYRSTCLRQV